VTQEKVDLVARVQPRRCHIDDCTEIARYGAKLDWTNQPTVLLCEEHAVTERQLHSVVMIHSEHPGEYHGQQTLHLVFASQSKRSSVESE
jgi:hypothetical protein